MICNGFYSGFYSGPYSSYTVSTGRAQTLLPRAASRDRDVCLAMQPFAVRPAASSSTLDYPHRTAHPASLFTKEMPKSPLQLSERAREE